ncbi:MAG: nitronate monooxygenase [Candidatus Binatus sp.]|uniref:NAD(P)H-dependent flavin oxidoreductase n=1 Tax=Candidatus Binatus sp. TaxID=2811406 RepID=UPI0027156DB8|nr:nitronate monooxygenase [Candidatus Binatus sp.]MDO8432923.1 nitronate monooxygenase [Candidatus Binatus sp.]
MLKTRFCELFGIEYPIVSAGMGGVALAKLAAAVSEADGLGTIALAGISPSGIHDEIAAARKLTRKPIAVNLLIPFLRPGIFEALANEPIAAVTLFWGDPAEQIPPCKRLGLKVIWQCGSAAEALAAKRAGADAIIAQGFEAGGHVRGVVTTFALIPEVRDAIGDLPMLAAGGIADGRGLAAALALGADGAVFGTRFLASRESAAHPLFKQALIAAHASDTVHTKLYDVGWPDAAHRVIRTPLFDAWERAGRPESGKRPGEGESNARIKRPDIEVPLVRYSVMAPSDYIEGDISGLAFYAGQSVSYVHEIAPAGEIVRQIANEARDVIASRLAPLAR